MFTLPIQKWLKFTRFNLVNQKGGTHEERIPFATIKHNTLYLKFEIIRSIYKVFRPKRMPDLICLIFMLELNFVYFIIFLTSDYHKINGESLLIHT